MDHVRVNAPSIHATNDSSHCGCVRIKPALVETGNHYLISNFFSGKMPRSAVNQLVWNLIYIASRYDQIAASNQIMRPIAHITSATSCG